MKTSTAATGRVPTARKNPVTTTYSCDNVMSAADRLEASRKVLHGTRLKREDVDLVADLLACGWGSPQYARGIDMLKRAGVIDRWAAKRYKRNVKAHAPR